MVTVYVMIILFQCPSDNVDHEKYMYMYRTLLFPAEDRLVIALDVTLDRQAVQNAYLDPTGQSIRLSWIPLLLLYNCSAINKSIKFS